MKTLFISHPASLQHLTPEGHPERPDRIRAINKVFSEERFNPLIRVEAPMTELETVALCHPMDYVKAIRDAAPKEGMIGLDGDTVMSPGSFEAALRAAPHGPGRLQRRLVDAGVGVEQLAHRAGAHQALPGVLAVDVEQVVGQFAQLRQRGLDLAVAA